MNWVSHCNVMIVHACTHTHTCSCIQTCTHTRIINVHAHTHTVTIGLKEVAVYPDDRGKPPVGQGLNKKAIVKLERNWPVDKSTREVVQDLDRLERMGYAEKLRKSTTKIGATFLDYVPETGTCVFEVR